MSIRWKKLGRVFSPQGAAPANRVTAGLPTAEWRAESGRIRVYFYTMDEKRDGRIGFVEVDAGDPKRVLYVHPTPVLDIGDVGTFDDSGVCPSALMTVGDRRYLFYTGVQRCEKAHPYFTGVAIAEKNETVFRRVARTPILERTDDEPFVRSAPTVLRRADGKGYQMWYVSATGWTQVSGKQYPTYVIRSAVSDDILRWRPLEGICLGLQGDEFGLGRPWALFEDGRYRLWYSIRSRSAPYRLGYAESTDGLRWERLDASIDLAPSPTGWDSEMICYPSVVDVPGRRYLFYNGNGYGASGFGVAVAESTGGSR